jgi:hypothetical protein
VVAHAPIWIARDAIEYLDHRADFHVEPGLLLDLARHSRFQGLADLDAAPRQAPLALERLESPPYQDDPAVHHDHGTHADDRALGVLPGAAHRYSPITLTMTRLRR